MIAEASQAEITSLVTVLKATQLEKSIKINEVNIARVSQAKIFRHVLEVALVDGFDEEDFPDLKKGRQFGPLSDRLTPDPNNGVQPNFGKIILGPTCRKSKKCQRSESTEVAVDETG